MAIIETKASNLLQKVTCGIRPRITWCTSGGSERIGMIELLCQEADVMVRAAGTCDFDESYPEFQYEAILLLIPVHRWCHVASSHDHASLCGYPTLDLHIMQSSHPIMVT